MGTNMPVEVDVNILTLNCWGIPGISKNRKERMSAIAHELTVGDYDIVCLQEVWSLQDYCRIKEKTCENLPHSHYFFSGVMGSGLCVFSKFPIEEVFFHQWGVNGYIHKIQHGDWFGGKGVGLCRVRLGGLSIHVYNAHLHAEYNRTCDLYRCHRALQAFDTAQFIRFTSANADLVVLGGDLNTEPGDLPYRIIRYQANLQDSGCSDDRGTNEAGNNSYSDTQIVRVTPSGKRIDYVMFRTGPKRHVELVSYGIPFADRVPHCNFSFSDHEAILASLKIQTFTNQNYGESSPIESKERVKALQDGIQECKDAFKRLAHDRLMYFVFSAFILMIIILMFTFHDLLSYRIFDVSRLLLIIPLCFTFFMATISNRIEVNVTKAAQLSMELAAAHDSM